MMEEFRAVQALRMRIFRGETVSDSSSLKEMTDATSKSSWKWIENLFN